MSTPATINQNILNDIGPDIYGKFWTQHLNTINRSLPVPAYWVCYFNHTVVLPQRLREEQNTVEMDDVTTFSQYGFMYAQAVHITGDGLSTTDIGLDNSPFLKGHISNGRNELDKIKFKYLETNYSFTDGFIRPWTDAVTYGGLVTDDLRATITAIAFQKVSDNPKRPEIMIPRTIIQFYRACPINVGSYEMSYADQQMNNRDAEFIFDEYKIWTNPQGEKRPPFPEKGGMLDRGQDRPWRTNPINYEKTKDGETISLNAEKTREFRTGNEWADNALDKVTNAVEGQSNRIASNILGSAREIADRTSARVENAVQGAAQNLGHDITQKVNDITNNISSDLGLGDLGQLPINTNDTPSMHSDFQRKKIHAFDSLAQKSQTSSAVESDDTPIFNTPESGGDIGILNGFSGSAKDAVRGAVDTPLFFPGESNPNKIDQKDTPSFISIQRSKAKEDDVPSSITSKPD